MMSNSILFPFQDSTSLALHIGTSIGQWILAFRVIELFRMRDTNSVNASNVKNIAERLSQDGRSHLDFVARVVMCLYVGTILQKGIVLSNTMRNCWVIPVLERCGTLNFKTLTLPFWKLIEMNSLITVNTL